MSKPAPNGIVPARRGESPLTWLRRRKDKSGTPLISEEQFCAGLRLAADYRAAEMAQRTTMSWSDMPAGRPQRGLAGFGADIRDSAIAARERVDRALIAVGPDLANILVDVCCYDTGLELMERRAGWPERSGKVIVQYALNALARHYGLLPDGSRATGRSHIRHWGSSDYRPAVDPD